MKLVILYEELASYFVACADHLSRNFAVEIHIIRKTPSADAPFSFRFPPALNVYDREKLEKEGLIRLVDKIGPDAIFCGGWSNASYLDVCRTYHPRIPVWVGFDNWWTGSVMQRVKAMAARSFFRKHFTSCFVPGSKQRELALKLGFPEENIFEGAYCGETSFFHHEFECNRERKKKDFPKRFIYVGRYAEEKNVDLLWQTFSRVKMELKSDWELWCLGTGPVKPMDLPGIKHFGFVQPEQMKKFISETGVFILPSSFEPWGVAVHEFACAGFPLILSDKVGAGEVFMVENENGFSFDCKNGNELAEAMKGMMRMSDEQLNVMSEKSARLGMKINLDTWADTVYELMQKR